MLGLSEKTSIWESSYKSLPYKEISFSLPQGAKPCKLWLL